MNKNRKLSTGLVRHVEKQINLQKLQKIVFWSQGSKQAISTQQKTGTLEPT